MQCLSIYIEKIRKKIMEKINELDNVRKLATIAKILDVKPIEGADNIEKIFVRGWQCVAKKGEYKPGDLCVYVEVDSIMPDGLSEEKKEAWKALNKQMSKVSTEEDRMILREAMNEIIKENTRPEFEFLRDKKFHIKTRRILGEISQGICFPLSILPIRINDDGIPEGFIPDSFETRDWREGEDVTSVLGVTQYIAPDPAVMGGDVKGELQDVGFLVSDEERLENLNAKYEEMRKFRYFKTEKLDGTSFAAYLKNGEFGVCGRHVNYKQPDDDIPFDKMNVYWKAALKIDLEAKMRKMVAERDPGLDSNIVFQGELIGEGIQKNLYKLNGQEIRFYNAFNIDAQEYLSYECFLNIMNELGLKTVPVLDDNYELPERALDMLEEADKTYSVLNPKQLIEGFVYVAKGELSPLTKITRSSFKRLSFKAKSRTFDINK
jgi:RNA ligase (TIGR02306 family)